MRRSLVAYIASLLWAVSAPSLEPWQPSVAPPAAASASDRLVLDGDTLLFRCSAYRDHFQLINRSGCLGSQPGHPLKVGIGANLVTDRLPTADSLWLVDPHGTWVTRVDRWSHDGGFPHIDVSPCPEAIASGDTLRMILRLGGSGGPRFVTVATRVMIIM